jgi:glycosyltransferase involved in cell wall biosynthesis
MYPGKGSKLSETSKSSLIVATTVPETLATILRGQPRRLGQDFRVALATSPGAELGTVAENEGLPIYAIPMARGIHPIRDLVSLVRMIGLFLREKPTLVHSYTPKAGMVCMVAAWVCRVPVRVHTFTGLIFPTSRGFLQKLLIGIDRLICACATHVVPEGEGVKRDLQSYKITGKRLELIGHGNIAGVNTSRFSRSAPSVADQARDLLRDTRVPGDAFVFCFIGRLNKDKGLDELVEAFKCLPENAALFLAGALDKSAPISSETRAAIASHPRIHHAGFLADVRPLLYASDILVLPSYREGFPNVLLQASAMEVPIIASDINGCNELVEPGQNGWLVEPRSVESLTAAMLAAMNEPSEVLAHYGRRARAKIIDRFEQGLRMVNFYRSLLVKT